MLIVICGATATGKSQLGLALAERLHSVIISADSRQIYREFDIGTAKPLLTQQQFVPHFLIDICAPTDTLTLAQYQQQAQTLIAAHAVPLLVGGTGLYIKAVTQGLKIPPVSPQQLSCDRSFNRSIKLNSTSCLFTASRSACRRQNSSQ